MTERGAVGDALAKQGDDSHNAGTGHDQNARQRSARDRGCLGRKPAAVGLRDAMLKIRNDLSVAPQTEAAMADRLAPALQVALAAKENAA